MEDVWSVVGFGLAVLLVVWSALALTSLLRDWPSRAPRSDLATRRRARAAVRRGRLPVAGPEREVAIWISHAGARGVWLGLLMITAATLRVVPDPLSDVTGPVDLTLTLILFALGVAVLLSSWRARRTLRHVEPRDLEGGPPPTPGPQLTGGG